MLLHRRMLVVGVAISLAVAFVLPRVSMVEAPTRSSIDIGQGLRCRKPHRAKPSMRTGSRK